MYEKCVLALIGIGIVCGGNDASRKIQLEHTWRDGEFN
jgi:hypothetical protein